MMKTPKATKAETRTISKSSSPVARVKRVVESFGNAAEAIGPCVAGMALFAVTRGQWSMIDAVLHLLDQVGRSRISLWSWTVAEYDVQVLARLRRDGRISTGRLVIDYAARAKNWSILADWKASYGPNSVRYVINHAKIATVESESGLRFLLRGSMNLNMNPRFEQFDICEGSAAFDLVRRIEDELPDLSDDSSGAEVYAATKLSAAFTPEQMQLFGTPKTWKPNREQGAK